MASPQAPVTDSPVVETDPDLVVVEAEPEAAFRPGALVLDWARLAARPFGIYLASRFVVLIGIWFASRINPPISVGSSLTGWDGAWYMQVADQGYPHVLPHLPTGAVAQNNTAFFPLYPLTVRAVSLLGFSTRISGLLVAGAAGLATVLLLWLLLRRVWDADAADRGVALFCFFPGAMVLSMTYSEPLMLALVLGCLLALHSRQWLVAGVLAGLSTACRPNAMALVLACGWAAAVAIKQRREWRSLVAPLLAPTGFVAFQGFLWARTGAVDSWWKTQNQGWGEKLSVTATWDRIDATIHQPLHDVNLTLAVAGTVVVAVTLVFLWKAKLPGPVVAYGLGVVVLALLSQTLGARPRFVLTAFPLVVAPARFVRGIAFTTLVACMATVLGAFTVLSLCSLLATP
ncbi:MAG: hypothetical protein QOD57_2204 [Actinomycetota bacterium]|jgi:hypothetical protein|nr:hypothetical protein [Actinomycetota bacterium]MDQ1497651.1 hypothetical protein [Actinomycetota bacterium]MDQ1504477.1 hypothetical protein [Actinomycetota bacterium]